MDKEKARRKIMCAFLLGAICTGATIAPLLFRAPYNSIGLVDVVLNFSLTYKLTPANAVWSSLASSVLIYLLFLDQNRFCAMTLFVYFVISKVFLAAQSQIIFLVSLKAIIAGLIFIIIIGYIFFDGARATFVLNGPI